MTSELNSTVLEVVGQGFAFMDKDEPLTILDDHPDDTYEPYRMGEDPLGRCLHPPDTLPFR